MNKRNSSPSPEGVGSPCALHMEVMMKQIVKIDEVLVDQIINEMISILDSDYCS